MSEAPESKPQTIDTFDGRKADGAEVADFYDPSCSLGCDLGVLTRAVPVRKGARATVPRTDVCSCAINRWQAAHHKDTDGKTSANPA